ncbi:MAG TPA: hypothetical protein VNP20_17530 [Nocardioidaceae bacterium]|nr:hypothetical protein [Nocardioidaceae bacterium]
MAAGTLMIPREASSSIADGSATTLNSSNSTPRRESNAFIIAQLLQPGFVKTRRRSEVVMSDSDLLGPKLAASCEDDGATVLVAPASPLRNVP